MKRTMLTAILVAAALLAGNVTASAADLDYGRAPTDRYSSAYEDPRYRDLYAPEPRAYPRPYVEYRRAEPVPPIPPAYVYRDNGPPHRYSDALPRDRDFRYGGGCVPRDEIKRHLINDGWRDFHNLDLNGEIARINARRPNGDLYALKVDRCSGEIVKSHFIERGGAVPYAYDNGGRYTRPYY